MSQYEMNEEDKLYDEFGNYIGPDLSDEDTDDSSNSDNSDDWDEFAAHKASPHSQPPAPQPMAQDGLDHNNHDDDDQDIDLAELNDTNIQSEFEESAANTMKLLVHGQNSQTATDNSNAIVLHEDKEYYKSAQETYGSDVEIQIEEEDTQPIDTPIIAPIKEKCFELIERKLPTTTFNWKFLASLMDLPPLIRNIGFIGHLHHGKTSFIDMLVKQTHSEHREKDYNDHLHHCKKTKHNNNHSMLRYTDTRMDEQDRGLSIKSVPISLVLPDLRDKHWLINCMDVPGHVNFSDELTASLRLIDGAVIVVDCTEGVLLATKRAIRHALSDGVSNMVLVLNKIDRLIIELRLPPKDAYLKLSHTVSEVNGIIQQYANGSSTELEQLYLHPTKGNVCFASSWFCWSFTLDSFAKIYSDYHDTFTYKEFAGRLWGDVYYNSATHQFVEKKNMSAALDGLSKKRTFVQFILEPLYKIYAHTLGSDPHKLFPLFQELGIRLKKNELNLDPKPLLSVILSRFFGESKGFVSMIIRHIPSPKQGNKVKILKNYCGNLQSELALKMIDCVSNTDVAMVNITKMYPRPNASEFDAFGRVFCGTVKVGDTVKILREGYVPGENEEDMVVMSIKNIWIYQGRYRVEINQVKAGNWALFGGIDTAITKTGTITHVNAAKDTHIFRPLKFNTVSVCKVAIEPIKPSELPKMTHGLRCINKSYPLCITRVEESGEHIVLGTGELYLDCVLHDLREMYSEIEIKVSDPVVSFCETVEETSSMQCFAHTKNRKNKLTMVCQPLDAKISGDILSEKVCIEWSASRIGKYFEANYGWDLLSGRNIWAFGPDRNGANILCDDTLPSEVSKATLNTVRNSIVSGFEWATREGPLCDEPIRNCNFKLCAAEVSENMFECGGGQIIAASRRVIYSAFMLATPRLMEPVLFVEAMCPPDCISAVQDVITHRRGRILGEKPKVATPFVVIYAELPAIDSFGFETDLRSHTQGQAFCLQVFNRWDIVPGDPMDENIQLMPLEPHPPHKLAREFMIKTRKRKGLAENVSYHKYFGDGMMKEFAKLYDD